MHQTSGEKLLSTVLQKFPLAKKWDSICSDHRFFTSWNCRALCGAGLAIGIACMLCLYVLVNDPALFSTVEDTVAAIFVVFCSTTIGGFSLYETCRALWYNLSPNKQKKNLYGNKNAARDCVAQKKAIRTVSECLLQFSTADLKLLQSHPQFNSVFKDVFEHELSQREKTNIVHNVNARFSENYISVCSEGPKDIFYADQMNNMAAQ